MNAIRSGASAYALGAIGLGLGGIATGDFAFAWPGAPGWVLPAFGSGFALILAAALLLRPAPGPLRAVAAIYVFWAIVLHAPRVFFYPTSGATWWALFETVALALAGLMLARRLEGEGGERLRAAGLAFASMATASALLHLFILVAHASDVRAWLALSIPLALAGASRALLAGAMPLRASAFASRRTLRRKSHAL